MSENIVSSICIFKYNVMNRLGVRSRQTLTVGVHAANNAILHQSFKFKFPNVDLTWHVYSLSSFLRIKLSS